MTQIIKPNTTILFPTLTDASAAHDLGFEVVHHFVDFDGKPKTEVFDPKDCGILPDSWFCGFITTETGPNAAERFMPMVGDLVWVKWDCKMTGFVTESTKYLETSWVKYLEANDATLFYLEHRIIERPHNGEMRYFPRYEVQG